MVAMHNALMGIIMIKQIPLAKVNIFSLILTNFSECNQACNLCYGPQVSQCYNCSELYEYNPLGIESKSGYLL